MAVIECVPLTSVGSIGVWRERHLVDCGCVHGGLLGSMLNIMTFIFSSLMCMWYLGTYRVRLSTKHSGTTHETK